jgi:hypothetical protein
VVKNEWKLKYNPWPLVAVPVNSYHCIQYLEAYPEVEELNNEINQPGKKPSVEWTDRKFHFYIESGI